MLRLADGFSVPGTCGRRFKRTRRPSRRYGRQLFGLDPSLLSLRQGRWNSLNVFWLAVGSFENISLM